MRSAAELEPIAFREKLTAEEDDVLFQHYLEMAQSEQDIRRRLGDWKHAAFFAGRAFDKGERNPEKLTQFADALKRSQSLAPTDSFRRKLNEIKSAMAGINAHEKILKRLARMGDAGSKSVLASDSQLTAIEAGLGVTLPASYKQYLKLYAHRQIGTYEPFTAQDLVAEVTAAWSNGLTETLLPFLEDNANLFCFDLTSVGPEFSVVYQPHDGTSTESWPNFAAWVEECWLAELDN